MPRTLHPRTRCCPCRTFYSALPCAPEAPRNLAACDPVVRRDIVPPCVTAPRKLGELTRNAGAVVLISGSTRGARGVEPGRQRHCREGECIGAGCRSCLLLRAQCCVSGYFASALSRSSEPLHPKLVSTATVYSGMVVQKGKLVPRHASTYKSTCGGF